MFCVSWDDESWSQLSGVSLDDTPDLECEINPLYEFEKSYPLYTAGIFMAQLLLHFVSFGVSITEFFHNTIGIGYRTLLVLSYLYNYLFFTKK